MDEWTWRGIVWVGLLWVGFQLILVAVLEISGHSYIDLYRDPIAIGRLPLHSGLLSNIGAMLMTAAAACALLAYFSLPMQARQQGHFLLTAGLLSGFIAADDLLLFHDGFFRKLRIPEALPQIAYGGLALTWLVRQRKALMALDFKSRALLAIALIGLGASASIDVIWEIIFPPIGFLEEPLKQIGVLFWLMFFFRTGQNAVRASYLTR